MSKKILVIDDDQDILEAIRIILEDSGYEVTTSGNAEIIKNLSAHTPDLIILDILLSGEDGRKVCKILKGDIETQNIPVIMMSAHVDVKDSILACGADGFIAKPFAIDELLDILNLHLNTNGSKEIS